MIRTFISFFYKPKKKILPKNKFLLNEISKNKDSRGRNLTIFEFLENNYSHKEDWKIEFERSLSLSKLKTKLDSTKKIIMNINNDNNLQIENKNNNEIIENDEKKKNSMKGILKISNFQNNLKKITENLKNPKEILLRSKSVIIENLGIEKKKKIKKLYNYF